MLHVDNITVAYDRVQVLFGLSLSVAAGEILCLLGRNGAGKTTTLKSIMGLLPLSSGTISFNANTINTLAAHQIPRLGLAYVPQGRGLFSELTVAQNLEIGLMVRGKSNNAQGTTNEDSHIKSPNRSHEEIRSRVLTIFPRLTERLKQRAETLSGGEQQMLAMARAMCMEPSVILLDEPTEGLQPSMITLIRDVIQQMKQSNVAVILVEQHVDSVLSIADRVAFIENGRNPETVEASTLARGDERLQRYLGV